MVLERRENVDVDCHNANSNKNFCCGVVEGFYGRPWTTDQRKKLFRRMKKMGLNTYLYAPKDDSKHRMFWRDQYSVEEADHLMGLIDAAAQNDVTFVYALHPGLDITFSSTKEVTFLKKKLEQVQSFGCKAFALLFDDIELEMCESDKENFQSFSYAQVSVTNEVFQHLGQPEFLFCPTEYCANRAVPNVIQSDYLNTIGSKLLPGIDVMWTGPKVISKDITLASILEITKVLRRPPVIWDNIHANDYDQRRMYLGPYVGRSTELIPHLRGVLTNPNCEFEANYIAMHTLAQWSKSDVVKSHGDILRGESPVSAVIKLETESQLSSDASLPLNPPMDLGGYNPKAALATALSDWIEEFYDDCKVSSKVLNAPTKPVVPPAGLQIPNVEAVAPDGVNPLENKNLNEIIMNAAINDSNMQPGMSQMPLNSLVSDSSDSDSDTSSVHLEPMDCLVTPGSTPCSTSESPLVGAKMSPPCSIPKPSSDCPSIQCPVIPPADSNPETMQIDSSPTETSPVPIPRPASHMQLDNLASEIIQDSPVPRTLTFSDLSMLVDLFYLPFQHGSLGEELLEEFLWVRGQSHHVCEGKAKTATPEQVPLANEWQERADNLTAQISSVFAMFDRMCSIPNRALLFDFFPYMWDLKGVLEVMKTFMQWLAMGQVPYISVCRMQENPYTWANKFYRDAFSNGEREPWVFRGGLQAEIQRLMPLDAVSDLLLPCMPASTAPKMCTVRQYTPKDEPVVYDLCCKIHRANSLNPNGFCKEPELFGDSYVGAYLTMSPEYCWLIEDEGEVVGYVVGCLDAKVFCQREKVAWIPSMLCKYPKPEPLATPTIEEKLKLDLHNDEPFMSESTYAMYPSRVCVAALKSLELVDMAAIKRALACAVAALRTNGSEGIHMQVNAGQTSEMCAFLGLAQVPPPTEGAPEGQAFMGRTLRVV